MISPVRTMVGVAMYLLCISQAWAGQDSGGGGQQPDERGVIEVRRQDRGEFRLNRSVRDTPLQIGKQKYQRGLGTRTPATWSRT